MESTDPLQPCLTHLQAGRLQEAEVCLQQLLQKQPRNVDALHLAGVISLRAGHHAEAKRRVEQAIEQDPSVPSYHLTLGEVCRAQQQWDRATICYERALALKPDYAEAHYNLGLVLQSQDRWELAAERYQRAVEIRPTYAKAWNNRGNVLRQMGRQTEAIGCYRQALETEPRYHQAYYNLGNALRETGRHVDAVAAYEQALALQPDSAACYTNLATALEQLDRHDEARSCLSQALALTPDSADAHNNMGNVLRRMNLHDKAVGHYERSLQLRPNQPTVMHNIGVALQDLGHSEAAADRFEQVLALAPADAEAHRSLAALRGSTQQIPVLEQLLVGPDLSHEGRVNTHFALGDLFDHDGAYDDAFAHYSQANRAARAAIDYDADDHSRFVDRLIASYSPERIRHLPVSGSDTELPVFIVGMPRSGTTLVEQIVSGHAQVHGAGELLRVRSLEESVARHVEAAGGSYPEAMAHCGTEVLRGFADKYVRQLRRLDPTAARITDKLPGNYARIGLIKALWPAARIIHCRRNGLDTCTSIFRTRFARGHDYSFDLDELGVYFLDYERLTDHWHRVFGEQICEVDYEQVVHDLEGQSRRMIDYLDLPWDDACLDFAHNRRAVQTASNLQVRRGLYSDSIGRWHRYETHLGPLLNRLPHHAD